MHCRECPPQLDGEMPRDVIIMNEIIIWYNGFSFVPCCTKSSRQLKWLAREKLKKQNGYKSICTFSRLFVDGAKLVSEGVRQKTLNLLEFKVRFRKLNTQVFLCVFWRSASTNITGLSALPSALCLSI